MMFEFRNKRNVEGIRLKSQGHRAGERTMDINKTFAPNVTKTGHVRNERRHSIQFGKFVFVSPIGFFPLED